MCIRVLKHAVRLLHVYQLHALPILFFVVETYQHVASANMDRCVCPDLMNHLSCFVHGAAARRALPRPPHPNPEIPGYS